MTKEKNMDEQKWKIRYVAMYRDVGPVGVPQVTRFTVSEGWTCEPQENGDMVVMRDITPKITGSKPQYQRYLLGHGSFYVDYMLDSGS